MRHQDELGSTLHGPVSYFFERPSISPSCWISSDFAMAKKEDLCRTSMHQLGSNMFWPFGIICRFCMCFCYQQVGFHSGYPWTDSFQQRRVCPEWIYHIFKCLRESYGRFPVAAAALRPSGGILHVPSGRDS